MPDFAPVHDRGLRYDIKRLVALSVPVVITQVGSMTLGVVDVLMVGRLGVRELDSASLGHVWLFGTLVFGLGVVLGLDPIVTQAHGRRDHAEVGLTLQRGLVLSILTSVPIALSWAYTGTALRLLGQPVDLANAAHEYAQVQLWSLPLFLAFNALRQYLQGRGIVTPSLWVVLVANVFNVIANWALIFGHAGAPAMGLEGAGIATASARAFLFVALVAWTLVRNLHHGAWIPWSRRAFELRGLRDILRHGLPVGIQYALEAGAFQVATLMAGRLGHIPLAAHTIVINMASLSFMVPMGLSQGATTRVGNLVGAGAFKVARRTSWIALALGAGVMAVAAVLFVVFREQIPRAYTDEPQVIALAASLFPIAAAFQIFDGIQVVGGGILRGLGKTRPAAIFNFMGYYLWALPIAWWFAFRLDLGVAGIWWALCLGLAAVAALLVAWIWRFGPQEPVTV